MLTAAGTVAGDVAGCSFSGRSRDLLTGERDGHVIANAAVEARSDAEGVLTAITTAPHRQSTHDLVGKPLGGGFREAVRAACQDDVDNATPLALLLDDLPVAALIAGYGLLYEGRIAADALRTSMKADICAGWRADGAMMVSVRSGQGVPVTVGPAPVDADEERAIDPQGWHELPPLAPRAMRRRRLIDVTPAGDRWAVVAVFEDTHASGDGGTTVLHQYAVTATIDATTTMIIRCSAAPQVLPWAECPSAADSAERLVGTRLVDVRERVRSEFRGTSTCTHLNDLLRSLGDVPALARHLHRHSGAEDLA